MDGSHFDALSRALAAGQSRRGLAGLLAGLALTGPLALVGSTKAAAKRKKGKKKKRRGGSAPPPGCIPQCTGKLCGDNGCGGTCDTCGVGLTCCGAACVDLATDATQCGACGRVCADGCEHGACECTNGVGLCPGTGCTCGARFQGLPPVCFTTFSATFCDADSDCPLGTNCLANGKCSGPCV